MDIRFISSLTAEDENTIVPALLKAVALILDQFPIAYTLRIVTSDAQVYQHTRALGGNGHARASSTSAQEPAARGGASAPAP
ncbi:MAG TPA: hypothetical protein VNI83_11705 [Vicinamibacterales bacterium]|nr:hypothetical protein [Vicinamibacterales bacterium]